MTEEALVKTAGATIKVKTANGLTLKGSIDAARHAKMT